MSTNFNIFAARLLSQDELFTQGHRACQGCSPALAMRLIGKALGFNMIVANATGGMEIICSPYPFMAGAVQRGHDFLYVCYDNEAYMNTGIQRSSGTPFGASTSTSPAGSRSIGQSTPKKDFAEICAAHNIPYVATANVAYPFDLIEKRRKAKEAKGR